MGKPSPHLSALIDLALSEDLGNGDLTTEALFPASGRAKARAVFLAKEPLVVSGLGVVEWVFRRLDETCQCQARVQEGAAVKDRTRLATLRGPLPALLSGERTALNFLRHLCGVATLTRRYVEALAGTGCTLLDTRKTTPGLRALEKAAVRAGGGKNHRTGLFDGVMIKDNHIAAAGSIRLALHKARQRVPPTVKIEVECQDRKQVQQALDGGADIIMLDNMDLTQMARAVKLVGGRAKTEASGRIQLATLRQVAETGVDYISVGALTHSAPNVDISLEILPAR